MKSKQSKAKQQPTSALFLNALPGVFLTLSALVMAFWISWHGLSAINFAFPQGYQLLDIDQHIQRYGPLNRYKKDFAYTNQKQHERLFSEIVTAIQNNGDGLSQIQYELPSGKKLAFLRQAEVIHLQDVANLIRLFNQVAVACTGLWFALLGFHYWKKRPTPNLKQVTLGLLGFSALTTITLILFGPTKMFYWLHTKIFPHNHQWFFYYQESLMTTLMKAPDLFGFIATIWAVTAILLFITIQLTLQALLIRPTVEKASHIKGKK